MTSTSQGRQRAAVPDDAARALAEYFTYSDETGTFWEGDGPEADEVGGLGAAIHRALQLKAEVAHYDEASNVQQLREAGEALYDLLIAEDEAPDARRRALSQWRNAVISTGAKA